MDQIAFYYKNGKNLLAFAPILETLFEMYFLRGIIIKQLKGCNSKEAGEAVLEDFKKSPSPILIVEDGIAIPADVIHVTFNEKDTFFDLTDKMRHAGIG